ncbi:MAG: thiosulfate oxidation carrier protein SoxY [Betaproteobacteria bacterium]|nr:thiosulfate oxidation carrier protein SoxY [Betaproteobacteria bacterium]
MNEQRRNTLKSGGGLGVLGLFVAAGLIKPEAALAAWDKKVFDAKTMDDAYGAIGSGKPVASKEIAITAPDIAENGAVVPVSVVSRLAKTERIYIMIEKNPSMVAANFTIPEGTEAEVTTRVKMGQTSNLHALVKADGKYYFATKEVKVTLGGCGG